MNKPYTLLFSPSFKLSLPRQSYFLTQKYDDKFAKKNKQVIKSKLLTLGSQPYIAPISERLLDLGINDYRQWTIDNHNIILYQIDEPSLSITLLLVMDVRQNIQKLLYELLLLS